MQVVLANISAEEWKNSSVPMISKRGGGLERSSCTFYNNSFSNGSLLAPFPIDQEPISCESWEYDISFYESTMVAGVRYCIKFIYYDFCMLTTELQVIKKLCFFLRLLQLASKFK